MDDTGIRFGITHNYKDTYFSLFMLYGELVGEKKIMSNVKNTLCNDVENLIAISADSVPTEEV